MNAFSSIPLSSSLLKAGSFQNMLNMSAELVVVTDGRHKVMLDSKLRGCSCDKTKIYRSAGTSSHSMAKERGKKFVGKVF